MIHVCLGLTKSPKGFAKSHLHVLQLGVSGPCAGYGLLSLVDAPLAIRTIPLLQSGLNAYAHPAAAPRVADVVECAS